MHKNTLLCVVSCHVDTFRNVTTLGKKDWLYVPTDSVFADDKISLRFLNCLSLF
jgi:hypothetical protein